VPNRRIAAGQARFPDLTDTEVNNVQQYRQC
jgi:hypothetical protein